MLRFPSLIKSYDTYCSCDPAIKQPPAAPAASASDADKEAYALSLIEYVTTLNAAHDTGDWSALILPGEQPTKFVLQPVDAEDFRELRDLAGLDGSNPQRIGDHRAQALLVRMALVDVPGIPDLKAKRSPHPKYGWTMAQAEVIQILDALNPRIVGELAGAILRRVTARPLA